MLNKKLLATLALGLVSVPIFAEGTMDIEWVTNNTVTYALYFLIVVLIIMVFMLAKTMSHISDHFNQDQPEARQSFMEKLFQVKSVSTDKDMMLDHEYDGIKELGNPPPPWFMFLFYGTILFAVIYFYRFSISGAGPTQVEEYETEMAEAQAAKDAAKADVVATAGPMPTAETVEFVTDAAALKSGKTLFNTNCKVCHGEGGGQPGVGPNLTDEYWIHGGSPADIFNTIENGISGKMTAWKGNLDGNQIQSIMSYINSLDLIDESQGGVAPAGEKYEPAAAEPEAPAEETSDSTEAEAVAEPS